jgi:uncharacterized protein (TIGR02453 family)
MGFKARPGSPHFAPELFGFLIEIEVNNNREWFQENKDFYESAVKRPLLSFIESFAPALAGITKNFRADSRSIFRIYRDVRFSKDKRPYKTHAAAHFRHNAGKDVHAPGFYLHIEPGSVFAGGGVWQPSPDALLRIRKQIASNPREWRTIIEAPDFQDHCELHGSSLKRPPRGFDPEHPLIEDLKRKDFIALVELDDSDILASDFVERFTKACELVAPFNRFLCKAVGVPF